ncbi:hypothetical protein A3K63_05230 [Candidatus Micrarchaeota archaeon RBG_16_49_10]|nr:MAG: hypothetical protein A3K63_05230 [Candidatus Micrarchaeota archaeon RBG_16_49_10]
MAHHVIIGNGIAGSTAAETLRANDKDCEITLIGEEKYPLYSRLNLENYVGGDCDKEHMILKSKDWYRKMKIDLRLGTKIVGLNPRLNYVKLDDDSRVRYDKLLIATGGTPHKLTIKGSELKGVHSLQTLDDATAIIESLEKTGKAVIIGGGFVGADCSVALKKRGVDTTILIREKMYWHNFLDEVASKIIHNLMEKNGVRLLFDEEAVEFIGDKGRISHVYTTKGRYIEAGMVCMGIGLRRNVDFLRDTDVKVRTGILVNKYLQTTNYPDIFAAGDVAEFYDVFVDQWMTHGNWVNAQKQGETAARNMLGQKDVFDDVSQYTTDIFGTKLMTIGDVEISTNDVIVEVNEEACEYSKIFLKDDRVVGAILIGDISPIARIKKMILDREEVSERGKIL